MIFISEKWVNFYVFFKIIMIFEQMMSNFDIFLESFLKNVIFIAENKKYESPNLSSKDQSLIDYGSHNSQTYS